MITALRALEPHELQSFTNTLVKEVVARVTDKIPHLESSVAVAELSVALHYVLDTPQDVLIWDVGHQGYIHKALTGRFEALKTMRQPEGISGFLKRDESPYDFFGAGHASTSISALTGVCIADTAVGLIRNKVAVIGDGSLTGGQSFEALNHLGALQADCLVVLNDNDGSIDSTMGTLHARNGYKAYFQSLGFTYFEEKEGNNAEKLVGALKMAIKVPGPKVLRIHTVRPTLEPPKDYSKATSFQWYAAEKMEQILSKHPQLIMLSPAMFASSGFGPLRAKFPSQLLDTGITEPHAITTAAGIVAAGGKAWVHIYSTFLQRGFDQVVHDVALQGLPVVFLVDRAGFVGADGPTHHGLHDLPFLMNIPGTTVWNPKNGGELQAMLEKAVQWSKGPLFIRYPKAETENVKSEFRTYEVLQRDKNSKVLQLTTGQVSAWKQLDTGTSRIHLAQVAPLPSDLADLLKDVEVIEVWEESMGPGGLFSAVASLVAAVQISVTVVPKVVRLEFPGQLDREQELDTFCN